MRTKYNELQNGNLHKHQKERVEDTGLHCFALMEEEKCNSRKCGLTTTESRIMIRTNNLMTQMCRLLDLIILTFLPVYFYLEKYFHIGYN